MYIHVQLLKEKTSYVLAYHCTSIMYIYFLILVSCISFYSSIGDTWKSSQVDKLLQNPHTTDVTSLAVDHNKWPHKQTLSLVTATLGHGQLFQTTHFVGYSFEFRL